VEPSVAQDSLFRSESLAARQLAWLGRPALALDPPALVTSVASVALAVATAALVTFGGYTRRVDLQGTVLPSTGLIAVVAPSAGRVDSISVHDGDTVTAGDPLYMLDLDTATKGGETQELVLKTLTSDRAMLRDEVERQQRFGVATRRQLELKVDNLKAQIEQASNQVATQQTFVTSLHAEYNKFVGLFQIHDTTLSEVDSHQQAWMQSEAALQQIRSTQLRLQAELGDGEYQLGTADITLSNDIDALRAKISAIDKEIANTEARRLIAIHAPGSGMVTSIAAYPGQAIVAAAPMLTIVPQHDSVQAELLAPSGAIGFVHVGARVLLRYSAFPYQKFGQYSGTVVSVSHAALRSAELEQLSPSAGHGDDAGPFYRVSVKPDQQRIVIDGREQALPVSMRVQGFVLLDRRPLYQWLLAPLYSFAHGTQARA
jgi:membrane fusion protein